jgi:hypothetical protein
MIHNKKPIEMQWQVIFIFFFCFGSVHNMRNIRKCVLYSAFGLPMPSYWSRKMQIFSR